MAPWRAGSMGWRRALIGASSHGAVACRKHGMAPCSNRSLITRRRGVQEAWDSAVH